MERVVCTVPASSLRRTHCYRFTIPLSAPTTAEYILIGFTCHEILVSNKKDLERLR